MYGVERLAETVQEFTDERWGVPTNELPPTKSSIDLAEFLIERGYIHRSRAQTLAIDDLLSKEENNRTP